MKKVLFLLAVAGMMSFAACNNNNQTAEPAAEEPAVEEMAAEEMTEEPAVEEVAAEETQTTEVAE